MWRIYVTMSVCDKSYCYESTASHNFLARSADNFGRAKEIWIDWLDWFDVPIILIYLFLISRAPQPRSDKEKI